MVVSFFLMKLLIVAAVVAPFKGPYDGIEDQEGMSGFAGNANVNFQDLISRLVADCVRHGADGTVELQHHHVQVFRCMLNACYYALRVLVNEPATVTHNNNDDNPPSYKYNLTLGAIDFLRTACFAYSTKEFLNEYSRACRSRVGQTNTTTCGVLRFGLTDLKRAMYTTGDFMLENLDEGLSVLYKLATAPDNSKLHSILVNGCRHIKNAMPCLLLPQILDGNRLKAGNAIAARYWPLDGLGEAKSYGSEGLLHEIFGSNASEIGAARVVITILALCAMATGHVQDFYAEERPAGMGIDECQEKAAKSKESQCAMDLVNMVGGIIKANMAVDKGQNGVHVDEGDESGGAQAKKKQKRFPFPSAPQANCALFNAIDTWFDNAIREAPCFKVLSFAFMSKQAFVCNGNLSGDLLAAANKFKVEKENRDSYSLWEVASFLVSSRQAMHNNNLCGSNILTCALVCLSGAIGDLMMSLVKDDSHNAPPPPADGPFVLSPAIKRTIRSWYRKIVEGTKLGASRITGQKHLPKSIGQEGTFGKTVHATEVTKRVIMNMHYRRQHEKSIMMKARTAAGFFMLTIMEDLNKDIVDKAAGVSNCKSHTSHLVQDGRKGGRRMYMIALMATPAVNYKDFRVGPGSHLIEKNQKNPDSVVTTDNNSEKPFRDIVGGALINTFLYPLAGSAFVQTLDTLAGNYHDGNSKSWKSDTATCVNEFISELREKASKLFNTKLVDEVQRDGSKIVGTDKAKRMMLQQLSFVNKFCEVSKNNGVLWEDMQVSFAPQPSRNNDSLAMDSDDSESFSDEGVPSYDEDENGIPAIPAIA